MDFASFVTLSCFAPGADGSWLVPILESNTISLLQAAGMMEIAKKKAGKKRSEGQGLIDIVFSWPLEDVMNKNLYKDKGFNNATILSSAQATFPYIFGVNKFLQKTKRAPKAAKVEVGTRTTCLNSGSQFSI